MERGASTSKVGARSGAASVGGRSGARQREDEDEPGERAKDVQVDSSFSLLAVMYKRRLAHERAPGLISATRRATPTPASLFGRRCRCECRVRHYLIDSVVLAATACDEKRRE